MSDLMMQDPLQPSGAQSAPQLKREHDSSDDFEHLEHELQMHHGDGFRNGQQSPLLDFGDNFGSAINNAPSGPQQTLDPLLDELPGVNNKPVPATPPPSADLDAAALGAPFDHQRQLEQLLGQRLDLDADPMGAKASLALVQSERLGGFEVRRADQDSPSPTKPAPGPLHVEQQQRQQEDDDDDSQLLQLRSRDDEDEEDDDTERSQSLGTPAHRAAASAADSRKPPPPPHDDFEDDSLILVNKPPPSSLYGLEEAQRVVSSKLPEPEKSPELDFVKEEILVHETTREKPSWMTSEEEPLGAPTKPLPPPPAAEEERSASAGPASDAGDSEFESEPEPSPARSVAARAQLGDAHERKTFVPAKGAPATSHKSSDEDEIAPKAIFSDIGIDAWFNPERLNPKVEALIYWRDPKKSGIVFGATLTVLLSLAYFSLISVVAYISLLTLTFTVAFRVYKTVLQAIQKTSDGHPFKDILDVDLTLPAEKVHEVADIAVANANAAVSELRRLFLVDDFVDSLKFGILLWSLTYLGSWFNGMTLIILGVVALFTLPKVYETNKTQIDQNLALVQAKINELTAKVKAAMPIGKKAEPAKEE